MKNTREVGSQFLVIFTVFVLISVFGCASAPEGYIEVKNKLRLWDTILSENIIKSEDIKLAIELGKWSSSFALSGVHVTQGNITIYGTNGKIVILPDNKIIVTIKEYYDKKELPFKYPFIQFTFIEGKMSIDFRQFETDYVLRDSIYKDLDIRKLPLNEFCLYFRSVVEKDYYLINIPIETSPDFVGNLGNFAVHSNWYDDL